MEVSPQRYAEIQATFSARDVALAATMPIFVLLPGHLLGWWLTGAPASGGAWGLAVPWLLGALLVPLLLLTRRDMLAHPGPSIPRSYWVLGAAQLAWMVTVSWFLPPTWSVVLAFLLAGLVANDARYFHDAPTLRANYLLGVALGWGVLFGIDALGGPGPVHLAATDAPLVQMMAFGHTSALALLVVLVVTAGRQSRELETQRDRALALERDVEVLRVERDVIRRTCALLSNGLRVSQVAHDVRSPLASVSLNLSSLRQEIHDLPPPAADQLLPIVDDLTLAWDKLTEMSAGLARGLRTGAPPRPIEIGAMLVDAQREMRNLLEPRRVPVPQVSVRVGGAVVTAPAELTSALANVLANAAESGSTDALVEDWEGDPDHLVLLIRDHGAAKAGREAVVARVLGALSLAPTEEAGRIDTPGATGRGYGVGLFLARVLAIRAGGCLEVGEPAEGDGLVFALALPRRAESSDHDPGDAVQRAAVAHRVLLAGAREEGLPRARRRTPPRAALPAALQH